MRVKVCWEQADCISVIMEETEIPAAAGKSNTPTEEEEQQEQHDDESTTRLDETAILSDGAGRKNADQATNDPISKSLNTGFHKESNEREARHAMRMTPRLMRKHNMSQAPLLKERQSSNQLHQDAHGDILKGGMVHVNIVYRQTGKPSSLARWMERFVAVVAKNFDVKSYKSHARGRKCAITFYPLAGYAFKVEAERILLMTQQFTLKKYFWHRKNTKSSRLNYVMGIVEDLTKKVEENICKEKEQQLQKLEHARWAAARGDFCLLTYSTTGILTTTGRRERAQSFAAEQQQQPHFPSSAFKRESNMATTATATTTTTSFQHQLQPSIQKRCIGRWRRRFPVVICCLFFLLLPIVSSGSNQPPLRGGGRGSSGSGGSRHNQVVVPPLSTSPSDMTTDIAKNERDNRHQTWQILRKYCHGCWSGSVDRYFVARQRNDLDYLGGGLNFRLCVQTTTKKGRWTVWNLEQQGDERITALSKDVASSSTSAMPMPILKLAFPCGSTMGLIFRIPQNYKKAPRSVLEVGFWETQMRRSCVMEYKKVRNKLFFGFWNRRNVLREILVMQQRRRPRWRFVGNTTNKKDIAVLPTEVTCSMSELLLRKRPWKAITQESVDLTTLEQKRVSSSSAVNQTNAREVLNVLLSSDYDPQRFCLVLPCGIAVSVPRTFGTGPCVFAHVKDKRVYALWLEYDDRTANASRSVLYTYE